MKNLSNKILIFYSFQQRKASEYNVKAFQPSDAIVRIKEVIEQLPLDISSGNYHFRFKSEFFENEQKIIGWIDISNLMAKVPMVSNAVYVKILKVKNNASNKLFNISKLTKVGLISNSEKPKSSRNNLANDSSYPNSVTRPSKTSKTMQPKKSWDINLMGQSPTKPPKQKDPKPKDAESGQSNFIDFGKDQPFVSDDSPEARLQRFREILKAEQKQKSDEQRAKEELDEKINNWGYSGAKTVNNLTTLLSTMHEIWPGWEQVSLSQLLKPEDVNSICKKALFKTHPDKNRNKQYRQKYLAKRVFELLNDAKKVANT